MKKFIKIISILTCLMMCFLFVASCAKEESPIDKDDPIVKPPEPIYEYILKDSKTDYVIVYPENSTALELMSVKELQDFFEQATGVIFPTTSDKNLIFNESSKYIAIGNVSFIDAAKASIDKKELGVSGYQIINKGKSLFLLGGQFGTLNATYRLLSELFNYECYAADEIVIDKNVKDVPLKNFNNLKFIPTIQMKVANYGELTNDTVYQRRMQNVLANEVIGVLGSIYHNFEFAVPPNEHPEWYNGGYLCMSVDVPGLSSFVANKIIELLKVNKTSLAVTFSQIDNPNAWCHGKDCGCSSAKEKYGTDSAAYIKLMNAIAEKVDVYLNENSPDREFYILLFAYNKSINAPAIELENGTYAPFDDSVKMHKRLGVVYAPFYTNSFFYSLTDEKNKSTKIALDKWAACSESIFYWSYGQHFSGDRQLDPFDNVGALKDNINALKDLGCQYWFDESATKATSPHPDWSRLKIYLSSKLCQDNSLNIETLTDNFFKNYFKDSAESMRKFYDEYTAWIEVLKKNFPSEVTGYPEENIMKSEYWQYKTIKKWLGYIDEAKESIQKYKLVDKKLYDTLYNRIILESVVIRRMVIKLYKSEFSPINLYNEYIIDLLNDAKTLGITYGMDVDINLVY